MRNFFWWLLVACFIAPMSDAYAGITCVINAKTGQFESKNRDDIKANEECKKRGDGVSKFMEIAEPETRAVTTVKAVRAKDSQAASKEWIIKPSHKWVREVIEDWAESAGYEVIWESRDFEINFKSDKVISTGSFWDALTVIGEAYRNSDSPFQIQPTAFKQIIIQPMQSIENKD